MKNRLSRTVPEAIRRENCVWDFGSGEIKNKCSNKMWIPKTYNIYKNFG